MCGRNGKAALRHAVRVSKNAIERAPIHRPPFMAIHASETLSSIVCVTEANVGTIQPLVRNILIQYERYNFN